VLDVACGAGRHCRLLRAAGHTVLAIDRDLGGVEDLRCDPGTELLQRDLEDGGPPPWQPGSFSAVVVTNYLHRPLLPALVAAVASGGLLIYETFAEGNARFGRPSNPAFLLRPGELLAAVLGELRVLAYEDLVIDEPRPAAIQRIAARRGEAA